MKNFLSHLVQRKQFRRMLLKQNQEVFLSHLVQRKHFAFIDSRALRTAFLSHLVQRKQPRTLQVFRHHWSFYPTWFKENHSRMSDNTTGVKLSIPLGSKKTDEVSKPKNVILPTFYPTWFKENFTSGLIKI